MLLSEYTSRKVPRSNCLLPLAVLLTTVMLTGCPKPTAIWLSKASKPGKIVFGIGSERGKTGGILVNQIRVDRCQGLNSSNNDDAMWVLSTTEGSQDLKQLVYGETPAGFEATYGPLPLTPGCYVAHNPGKGMLRFDVDAQGLARERK